MSKYKVGDKVRVVSMSGKNQMYHFFDIGDICTVEGFPEKKDIGCYDKDTPYLELVRESDNLNQLVPENCVEPVDAPKETVNHPSHYNTTKYECIDEMIALFGFDDVEGFCKCNVYKYKYRYANKNGDEDIKKSEWYMDKLIWIQSLTPEEKRAYLSDLLCLGDDEDDD